MLNLPLNQLIATGVQKNFEEECMITDECTAFRTMSAADLFAEVVIAPLDSIDGRLQIEIDFWFCHRDYERMNFSHIDMGKMMFIRETLSQHIAWSKMCSYPFSSDDVNMALVRNVMTDISDLESMSDEASDSRFFDELANVAEEACLLYNALYAVASSQVTDPALLSQFCVPTHSEYLN